MLFNSWEAVAHVMIMATLGYIVLITMLRVSGKRTLSKMNMFDFVITIALGSTFATMILSKDIALVEGVVALAFLILLQFAVARLSVRYAGFQQLVKGQPDLLYFKGHYLQDRMRSTRIVPEEIRFAARAQGITDMADVGAVILETDGTFSVLPDIQHAERSSLEDVSTPDHTSGS